MRKSLRVPSGLSYEGTRHGGGQQGLLGRWTSIHTLRLLSGLPQCLRMPLTHHDLVETLVLLNVRQRDIKRLSQTWHPSFGDPYGLEVVDPLSPRNLAILQEWPLPRPKSFAPEKNEPSAGLQTRTEQMLVQPLTPQNPSPRQQIHGQELDLPSARSVPGMSKDTSLSVPTLHRATSFPSERQHSKSTNATDDDIVVVDAMEALPSPWAEEPIGGSRFIERFEDPRLSAFVPEVSKKEGIWSKMPKLSRSRRSSKANAHT